MSSVRLSDSDLGWLAGLIDGEGSFLARRIGPTRTNLETRITIAGSDWRTIRHAKELIHKITGRKVPARPHTGSPDCWLITLSDKPSITALLSQLLKHLQLKRPQAAFIHAIAARTWVKGYQTPAWVDTFVQRVQWFNRHRMRPDGTWYPTAHERLRQSRGKPATQEPVETVQDTAKAEETVHE